MKVKSFKRWLKYIKEYNKNKADEIVFNCETIEKHYGDLEKNYIDGRLKKIIEELDNKNHKILIANDDLNNEDAYKLALKTYLKFKENVVLDKIMNDPDLDPDSHDGSYELVKEALNSISKIDETKLEIKDLDMLYAMSVGTWQLGIPPRIDRINNSNLPDEEKKRLKSILNKIVEKAKNKDYSSRVGGEWSIGMIGTGFQTFKGNSSQEDAKLFISLLLKIKDLDNDDEIFNILEEGFKDGISGIQSGSSSTMLHCLKPEVFPIINGRVMEAIIVLEGMGVVLNKPGQLTHYIENTKILKKFRDEHCKFKNYRVLDKAISYGAELTPPDDNGEIPNDYPPLKIDLSIDFSRELNFGNLYFLNEGILKSQISTAFKSGKSIILIGPPGTGKSKLAKIIAESYKADSKMVTAMSDWSSYDTIGGYKPYKDGTLYFEEGIFLSSFKSKDGKGKNQWLIIDEINRADIDKSFGPFFSALSSDDVELGLKDNENENIEILLEENLKLESEDCKPENNQYIIPKDWRIIGTMNTFDKTSLYEMSYAFMRRFAFIPVAIPKNIDDGLVKSFFELWEINLDIKSCKNIANLWKVINKYRKIGPAIIEDIGNFIKHGGDYTSAVVIYILPQLEGLFTDEISLFINELKDRKFIEDEERLIESIEDFFNINLVGE